MDLGNVLRAVFNLSSLASLSNFDLSSLSIFGLILPLLSLAFSACSSLRLDSLTAPINILAASSALESISFPLDDDDSET